MPISSTPAAQNAVAKLGQLAENLWDQVLNKHPIPQVAIDERLAVYQFGHGAQQ
jgi:hypothetical protein